MAMQSPFFGKREAEAATLRRAQTMAQLNSHGAAAVPAAGGAAAPAAPAVPGAAAGGVAPAAAPALAHGAPSDGAAAGGAKLIVGPNIKLKGVEITDCDTLVVEGMVEATMDSRLMQIAPCGAFKGSACIDIAEIHGNFEGDLTVRDQLKVFATGRISGRIRYGKLVVEEGGQLSGEVAQGADKPRNAGAAARAQLQAA